MFERYQVGGVCGGQLMTSKEVENFPGFPEGISGPELMDRMRKQSGADLRTEDAEYVDVRNRPFTVQSSDSEIWKQPLWSFRLGDVGGGHTATEEALYLTKYADHVHVLVQRDKLRASKAMQDRYGIGTCVFTAVFIAVLSRFCVNFLLFRFFYLLTTYVLFFTDSNDITLSFIRMIDFSRYHQLNF